MPVMGAKRKKTRPKWGRRVAGAMRRARRDSRGEVGALIGIPPDTFRGWFTQSTEPDPGIAVYVHLTDVLDCTMVELMEPKIGKEYLALPNKSFCPTSKIESMELRSELAAVRYHLGNAERLVGKGEGD